MPRPAVADRKVAGTAASAPSIVRLKVLHCRPPHPLTGGPQLREQIEQQPDNPRHLTTARGFGYRFEESAAESFSSCFWAFSGKLTVEESKMTDTAYTTRQTWKELPQPQVDFTCGLLNLNPAPSKDST